MHALTLETFKLTKRFGAFTALDGVSLKVRPGTVHALLGENGAGKSTFVKCVVGYYRPEDGAVLVDGRECDIHSPTVARDLGIGMVYQHFTVVTGMTVAENLLLARGRIPAVIDWPAARAELSAFLATAPFQLDLDATPLDLSAGEKQKLEILKQLRDLKEDAERGRLYLPSELLDEAGIRERDPNKVLAHPNLAAVCDTIAVKAEERFANARHAIARCARGPMRPAVVMMHVYHGILVALRRRGWRTLDQRASLSKPAKLWIALRHGLF